jgi:predicted nucleic acid-binding protein
MPFVVDASVTAAWILPDETHSLADECERMLAIDHALVPAIWWFEIRNLLLISERRGRLDRNATSKALEILAAYPIVQDRLPDEGALLSLARTHRLTAYDAAYLELAIRSKAPMATLDRRLATAAASEGVTAVIADGK